jgi:hypothetical protein
MPPLFNQTQKIPEPELLDILASKAPQNHKAIIIEQGFDPQTATIQEFVEISECAETKEALGNLHTKSTREDYYDSDDSERGRQNKKPKKTRRELSSSQRQAYFCKHHGPNPTHHSETCKVLLNEKSSKLSWKKPDNK